MNELDLFDDDDHYMAVSGYKPKINPLDIPLPLPTSGSEQYPDVTGSGG